MFHLPDFAVVDDDDSVANALRLGELVRWNKSRSHLPRRVAEPVHAPCGRCHIKPCGWFVEQQHRWRMNQRCNKAVFCRIPRENPLCAVQAHPTCQGVCKIRSSVSTLHRPILREFERGSECFPKPSNGRTVRCFQAHTKSISSVDNVGIVTQHHPPRGGTIHAGKQAKQGGFSCAI